MVSFAPESLAPLGIAAGVGVAVAAAGAYFAPAIAQGIDRLGQVAAAKLGRSPEKGGVLARTGWKSALMAATWGLAPGVGQWLVSGEASSLMVRGMKAVQAFDKSGKPHSLEVQAPPDWEPEMGTKLSHPNGMTYTIVGQSARVPN